MLVVLDELYLFHVGHAICWNSNKYIREGLTMEVTEKDSEAILELTRQIPKGAYSRERLMRLLSDAKGPRPINATMKDIPDEIIRVGNRWGITYLSEGLYSVRGGQIKKGKIKKPKQLPPKDSIWEELVSRAIELMPQTEVSLLSFRVYLTKALNMLGIQKAPTTEIWMGILTGEIRASVEVRETTVYIYGGRGEGTVGYVKKRKNAKKA